MLFLCAQRGGRGSERTDFTLNARMVTTELDGLTAEEAFQALKRQSQRTNIKLHTIADKIIGGRSTFPAYVYRVK